MSTRERHLADRRAADGLSAQALPGEQSSRGRGSPRPRGLSRHPARRDGEIRHRMVRGAGAGQGPRSRGDVPPLFPAPVAARLGPVLHRRAGYCRPSRQHQPAAIRSSRWRPGSGAAASASATCSKASSPAPSHSCSALPIRRPSHARRRTVPATGSMTIAGSISRPGCSRLRPITSAGARRA